MIFLQSYIILVLIQGYIEERTPKIVQYGRVSTLTVTRAQASDVGAYSCRVEATKTGEILVEKFFEVIVEAEIKIEDELKYDCDQNSQLTVTCLVVSSYPTPNVSWIFAPHDRTLFPILVDNDADKIYLSSSRGRWIISQDLKNSTYQLQVQNVSAVESGNYTCVADNLAGVVTATIEIFITPAECFHSDIFLNPEYKGASCGAICIPLIIIICIATVLLVFLTVLSVIRKKHASSHYKAMEFSVSAYRKMQADRKSLSKASADEGQ